MPLSFRGHNPELGCGDLDSDKQRPYTENVYPAHPPGLVEPGSSPAAQPSRFQLFRNSLVLRDTTTLLALLALTVVLFGVTLALFRSFQAHRDDLGKSWTAQARAAMARHDPAAAVPDLRAALSYAPDDRGNQLLLAEALAGSNHENEAASYFQTLWTARPGDGFVNLQLARLARRRGDATQATEYYRAAIFGDWGAQGTIRRRECRLELAGYLTGRGELGAARDELLIVSSNSPASAPLLLFIGERLAAAADDAMALGLFERALAAEPANETALVRAEAASLATGLYAKTEELLGRAKRQGRRTAEAEGSDRDVPALLSHDAARLEALSLSRELPSSTRGSHLLAAATLAQTRLRACSLPPPSGNAALTALSARWKSSGRELRRRTLAGNAESQDALAGLIVETEVAAAQSPAAAACGSVSGDDLFLLVAASAQGRAPGQFTPPRLPAVEAFNAKLQALAAGTAKSAGEEAVAESKPKEEPQ